MGKSWGAVVSFTSATPIALTISEQNGQFYFQVRFASF